jgi:hypothetical protein
MADFGISGVETSGSAVTVLAKADTLLQVIDINYIFRHGSTYVCSRSMTHGGNYMNHLL